MRKNTRRRYVGGRRTSGRGWDPVPTNVIFFVVLFIFTSRSSKQRDVGDADPYGLLRDGRLRVTVYASTPDPHPPRRGRRPRRPAVTVSAGLAAFRRPLPRRGIHSRHIMRHTARLPPAVGVGVLDDPFLRPPPTLPRSSIPPVGAGFHPRPACVYHRRYGGARRLRGCAGCGRQSRPQRGNPRRGFPL